MESICYLENVVLDVTDLNLLVGAPVWSVGGQQRPESKKKPNNKLVKGLNKWLTSLCGYECVFLSSVNLSALTCQKLWSEGLCGRKTVSPPPQMSHLTSPCCSGNEGLREKHISSSQLHSQDSFLETRKPEVWTLMQACVQVCRVCVRSSHLTSESFSKVSRARKCFHQI